MLAVLLWKRPRIAILVSFLMIVANVFIDIQITQQYSLQVIFLSHQNYELLMVSLARPWNKLVDIGFGLMLAHIYWQIKDYRKLDPASKAKKYPTLHYLHQHQVLGTQLGIFGFIVMIVNLLGTCHFNADTQKAFPY